MGNKIITEKDFWMCSSGAMPAQLQGTRKSNKKSSGDVYITVADTATSSWIDFGCTKNMLWAALLTAVAVIVVVALIVGTGGIAAIGLMGMMAIGAAAGVAGGVIAAVDGALKCGQKNATARTWDGSKDNMLLTGTPAITGDRTMTCSIGGVVKFAPEIKSWTHALALGGFNYVSQLAGCALGGAGVGAGGFLAAGLAGGSLALAAPTFSSVLSNVAGSFTGIWGGSRALFGLNSLANEHAYGNVQDAEDAGSALVNGGIPEIGMGQRIFSGQAQPSDYLLFLYLLNIKAKGPKPAVEEPNAGGDKDGNTTSKEEGNRTPEDEGTNGSKGQGESKGKPKEGDEGNAYEESIYRQDSRPNSSEGSKPGRVKSSVNENGDVVPANKDGQATVADHVRGSEPKKSDSPYTSFSEGKPGVGKKYGDNVIEVDIKKLEADIANGKVKDVEVLRPEKVQAELQGKVDAAKSRYDANPTPKNMERLQNAQRDLDNTIRDREVLIKGQIPAEYIKVYPNE
ncbi:hypothetical protein [Chryseobacterium limigenitum]|uniref:DUF4280 domain-containing protein n=1 Tax=Chryseobacterium limigenitum TaxID=1612149 RepID=A0A1K2IP41_9FLAO|nr:hypothetical protein [Chryseobacterium limigenitum]SFZ94213.1 hypothetical protein SAMN05216324_106152 [Chryseobacterium limigenitum]